MCKRLFPWAALFGLLLFVARPATTAEPKAGPKAAGPKEAVPKGKALKPAFVVRLKALDELIADGRYLFALADQEEYGKQLEKLLQSRAGPKGLEGLDTKKPIGLYGNLKDKLPQSEVVLLLPIADEKAFLGVLENLDLKPEKGKDGLYKMDVEGVPFPVLFRFANGYLYGTLQAKENSAAALDKARLPLPASVLGGGGSELLSLTLHIDQFPASFKQMASGLIDTKLDELKDEEPPGETAAQKAAREATLEEVGRQLKAVLTDGAALTARVDVDRKKHDLSLSLGLSGKPGSGLAGDIAALGALKSVPAGLIGRGSAAHGSVTMQLPAKVRKVLGPAVDDAFKKIAAQAKDKDPGGLADVALDALRPTAKAGLLDAGFDLRGPGKGGKYTAVAAIQVADGEGIEKALQTVAAKLPAKARAPLTLDFAKAAGVNIHRLTPEKGKGDAKTKELLGEGPVYFAVRKDAVLVGLGEDALEALKAALGTAPKVGHPIQFEVSLARVAKLLAPEQKAAPDAAKKAFTTPGSDKVSLSLEADTALRLKLSAKGQVITFISLLVKAKREEE
jgi:hypothetical protein